METLRNVGSAIALSFPPSLRNRNNADTIDLRDIALVQEAKLLATGGYNSVWLVKLHKPLQVSHPTNKFSLQTNYINSTDSVS